MPKGADADPRGGQVRRNCALEPPQNLLRRELRIVKRSRIAACNHVLSTLIFGVWISRQQHMTDQARGFKAGEYRDE